MPVDERTEPSVLYLDRDTGLTYLRATPGRVAYVPAEALEEQKRINEFDRVVPIRELRERVEQLEAALRMFHTATDPWMDNAAPQEKMTVQWMEAFDLLASARAHYQHVMKGQRLD